MGRPLSHENLSQERLASRKVTAARAVPRKGLLSPLPLLFLAWWAMAIPVPRQLDLPWLPWLRSPVSCAAVFVNTYTAE